jgi:hypothetical protein
LIVKGDRGRRLKFCLKFLVAAAFAPSFLSASDFRFDRETFAFANAMVFEYREGIIVSRRAGSAKEKEPRYTRRCFVMSRAAVQFHKFARFDPKQPPLDDKALGARIRAIARRPPWHQSLPAEQRIVFPGYANLREMSKARTRVLQQNLGLGWPAYLRVGNARMFFNHAVGYQEKTHANLEATLVRGDFFIAYLSDYPTLHINHSVLVYAKGSARNGIDHYMVYDPNHPNRPFELKWSPKLRMWNYEKDEEFVGGYTRVYQVYGKLLQ